MTRRIALITCAVAALLVPLPAALVERYYSSTLFPAIQSRVTTVSNLTPVAWFDLFVLMVLATLLALSGRDLATARPGQAVGRVVIRLLTAAAVVYLAFLVMWGFNYRREALRTKVPFDASRVTPDAALALARESVSHLNALHAEAHGGGWPDPGELDQSLARSFRRTTASLGLPQRTTPGRPKRSLLDLYFRRAGVAGMTDPFFLETLVASDLLPFERPHVIAHEWAHLAGVTDEGEANFIGWLTCARGTPPQRYSGWLFLYGEVMEALPRATAQEVAGSLAAGPRADLAAIRERYAREISPRLSRAGWQVYDQFLKANRLEAGTGSYAEVIQLVLGTALR